MIFDILANLANPVADITKAILNFLEEKQVPISGNGSLIVDSKGSSKNKLLVVQNSHGTTFMDLRNPTSKIEALWKLYKKGCFTFEEFTEIKKIIILQEVYPHSTKRNVITQQSIDSVNKRILQKDKTKKDVTSPDTLTNLILKNHHVTVDDNDDDYGKLQRKNPTVLPVVSSTTPATSKTHREIKNVQCSNCEVFIPSNYKYYDQSGSAQKEMRTKSIDDHISELDKKVQQLLFEKRESALPDDLQKENKPKRTENKKTGKNPAARPHKTRKNIIKNKKATSRTHTKKSSRPPHITRATSQPKPRKKDIATSKKTTKPKTHARKNTKSNTKKIVPTAVTAKKRKTTKRATRRLR